MRLASFVLLLLLGLSACQLVAVPVATCTPSTCAGCCDAYDVCQSGLTGAACGHGGLECQRCGDLQSCSQGSCGAIGGGLGSGGGAGGGGGGAPVGGGGGGSTPRAWVKMTTNGSPPARSSHAMAYDSARHRVVLFGGEKGLIITTLFTDTWEFDGTTWGQVATTGPSGRDFAAMEYDPEHQQTILFGGLGTGTTRLGDTWAWNGATWTALSPATNPPARSSGRLAWSTQLKALVLFGGTGTSTTTPYLNDLWKWTGTNWEPLATTGAIGGRSQAAFAYNPTSHLFVAFGGINVVALAETWQLSDTIWTKLVPAASPAARSGSQMAYDGKSRAVAIFGGFDNLSTFYGDTWTWAEGSWTPQAATSGGPPARGYHGLVYDAALDRLVLFGGENLTDYFDDTWEF